MPGFSRKFNDDNDGHAPPGSMDPFLEHDQGGPGPPDADPEGISIFAGLIENLLARFDFEASNIRITLVHPDNAEYNFSIANLRYFTEESVDDNSTKEDSSQPPSQGETRSVRITGIRLSMRDLSPLPVSEPVLSPLTWTPTSPQPSTPMDSSDSEMDEQTEMMMSQSLVSLPPRPPHAAVHSPALSVISSAASSMYQSAISVPKVSRPSSPSQSATGRGQGSSVTVEDTILALSDPIVLRVITPPAYVPPPLPETSAPPSPNEGPRWKGKDKATVEKIKVELSVGLIAAVFHARNVRGILETAQALALPSNADQSTLAEAPIPGILEKVEAVLQIKGCIALIAGVAGLSGSGQEVTEPGLLNFFSRPLSPPNLRSGYIRIHLDALRVSLSTPDRPQHFATQIMQQTPSSQPHAQFPTVSCTISDISILAFHSSQSSPSSQAFSSSPALLMHSSPVLITDQQLLSSYHSPSSSTDFVLSHSHPSTDEEKARSLPVIDVVDWTDKKTRSHGTSLRPWRAKAQAGSLHQWKHSNAAGTVSPPFSGLASSPPRTQAFGKASNSPTSAPGPLYSSISPSRQMRGIPSAASAKDNLIPALVVNISRRRTVADDHSSARVADVSVKTNVLHAFIGLECIPAVVSFLDEAIPSSTVQTATEVPSPTTTIDEALSYTDNIRDEPSHDSPEERERKRLERLVIDDLDLAFDYSMPNRNKEHSTHPNEVAESGKRKTKASSKQMWLRKILTVASVS